MSSVVIKRKYGLRDPLGENRIGYTTADSGRKCIRTWRLSAALYARPRKFSRCGGLSDWPSTLAYSWRLSAIAKRCRSTASTSSVSVRPSIIHIAFEQIARFPFTFEISCARHWRQAGIPARDCVVHIGHKRTCPAADLSIMKMYDIKESAL
jgi:hypothetical protein